MTRSPLGRLRRFWLDVHLWIGVGLFVALVPLGISGALLVWHDPLDELIHPHRFAVSRGQDALPASTLLAAGAAAFGDRALPTQLRMPEEAGEPAVVIGRLAGSTPMGQRPRTLSAWIDPINGRIVDVAEPRDELIGVMHRLHGTLLIPGQGLGRKVVGWMGWAMTLSCLTGLWLWWPRNGAVLKALRWRRSPSTFNNLHHLVGFWVLIPLLLVSLTGVYISFPETSRKLFGVETSQGPREKGAAARGAPRGPGMAPPLAAPGLPIDMAVAAAMAEQPDRKLASINLPTEGRRPAWRIQFAGEGHVLPVTVQISDADGSVVKGRAGADQPDPLSRRMRKIHDAQETPFIWQLLVFLTGVAPPLLGVTGIIMWLRRRARRRHLTRPAADS